MRLVQDLQKAWIGRPAFALKTPGIRPPVAIVDAITVEPGIADVFIPVLANDVDPEGGAMSLVSAFAALGTASVEPDGRVRYVPPAIEGFDTIVYEVSAVGGTDTGQVDVTLSIPQLVVDQTADNRLEVEARTAAIDITVTDPATFAATYPTDTGLLSGGPVNLAPPEILGAAELGQTLTAIPGLWIAETSATPDRNWQWRRDGLDIAGATAATLTLVAANIGATLEAVETMTGSGGARSASASRATGFVPSDDAALLAWFDADETATITESGGAVLDWASRAGSAVLNQNSGPNRPITGTRLIGGRNVLDFDGIQFMTCPLTLATGDALALHMAVEIDGTSNAFAALVAMDAANDFQIDAEAASQFDGRLNLTGVGATTSLSGGPFAGPQIVSVVFDRLGAGLIEVWIGGSLRATTAMIAALDLAQTFKVFTNRSQNASLDGAAGEIIVTSDVALRAAYHDYLAAKWGIS